MLSRIRFGAHIQATSWLKVFGMGQDARVPFFGTLAPNTLRDSVDLQEAGIELLGERKTGFGAVFGRQMYNYGEARLIGIPQWGNVARTFDGGRMYYRHPKLRVDFLLASPAKVRSDSFNVPNLGERIWGTYLMHGDGSRGVSWDLYALRHSQNKIGGWTGVGTLGTNSFGGRLYGPLPRRFRYSLEAINQGGHMGSQEHRAHAWFAGLSRKTIAFGRPLEISLEGKAASGTSLGSARSGTFDQLSPANHDKFGHEDLFGWRNIRNARALATFSVTKAFAVNLMYSNSWLTQASDGLYNGQGKLIARSAGGDAGRHIGHELDGFVTYRSRSHLFGAGYGHFFRGEFIQRTTPHANPRYLYVFQQYSF